MASTNVLREPEQERRLWLGIAVGTLVLTVSFWCIVYAFLAESVGDRTQPLAAAALGTSLIPLVFVATAFTSGHPSAPMAVVKAMALSLMVGIPVLAAVGDAVTGLVAGFGAGAVAALRRGPAARTSARSAAVAVAALVAFVLTALFPPIGLGTAPSLPLMSVGLADRFRSRVRAEGDIGP